MHTSRRQLLRTLLLVPLAAWFLPKPGQAQEQPIEDLCQMRVSESDLEEARDLLALWYNHRWSSDAEAQAAWWTYRKHLGYIEP